MFRHMKILVLTTILLNNIKEMDTCPSQSSNIDIHDLLKQKQVLTGAKQALASQKVESLLPVHHQIQQESQAIKEFMIVVIFANTISFLLFWNHSMLQVGSRICCKLDTWNWKSEEQRRYFGITFLSRCTVHIRKSSKDYTPKNQRR